jgi:hypothetical protein
VTDAIVEPRRTVRVSLVGCSGVLGDIIRTTLGNQPDIVVVDDLESIPAGGTLSVQADVLVWNNADESRVERLLLDAAPPYGPRVLATLGDGRDSAFWELAPRRTPLGPPSPDALVQSIRASFSGSGGTSR